MRGPALVVPGPALAAPASLLMTRTPDERDVVLLRSQVREWVLQTMLETYVRLAKGAPSMLVVDASTAESEPAAS